MSKPTGLLGLLKSKKMGKKYFSLLKFSTPGFGLAFSQNNSQWL
jgi:hypothetical protein